METTEGICSIGDLKEAVVNIADNIVGIKGHINQAAGDAGEISDAHRYLYAAQESVREAEQYEYQAAATDNPLTVARLLQLAAECRERAQGLINGSEKIAVDSAGVLKACAEGVSTSSDDIVKTLDGTGRTEGQSAISFGATLPMAVGSIATKVQAGIEAMPTGAGTPDQFHAPLGSFYNAMSETTEAIQVIATVDANLREYAGTL